MAAAAVPLASALAVVAVVLREPAVLADLLPGPAVLVQVVVGLAQVPPEPVLLDLVPLPLPQVVVESEVPLHLPGRQSFSAAMARNSPPTGKPTYARVPSTR